ncbi:hypothetical protein CWI36_2693p0010 [Hamiltosporidium magnivora]|uniref:Uncharacterized protein n=1 Tax=Hamiltosporidium magnivora TaxID=148818 RepID=A0A4Q9KUY0_9MICR|nr:hypothetical protein CWI36_2693p0010 [Hamiltosporidium magnivora]
MISHDRRRGIDVIIGAEMYKQPTPPLKEVKNEEDSVKQVNSKNILPLILDDVTRPEEPTIEINDNSDVEKENKLVKVMEEITTNEKCCEDTATLLEGVSVYKYLGIIEDSRRIPTRSSFEEVQSKLISRV